MGKGRESRIRWNLLFLVLLAFSGCQRTQGGLSVVGSTSVEPFAEALAEEFMNQHPREKIFVQGGGSSAGIQAVRTGAAEVGMSSRNLMKGESDLISIPIIYDAIAVIVHRENPLGDLTLDQIRKIFSGEFTRWSEMGGKDRIITLVTREEGSGTREAFQTLIMGKKESAWGPWFRIPTRPSGRWCPTTGTPLVISPLDGNSSATSGHRGGECHEAHDGQYARG